MDPTDIQQPRKSDPIKVCGVCGDKALGYNFNAVTCESCKAFFRRNALRNKEFKCPFEGSCKVDLVTRRFCQKCRLRKCFEIGMKKEWIMSEDEKKMKRSKIEENRSKRRKELNDDSNNLHIPTHNSVQNLDTDYSSSNSNEVPIFLTFKSNGHLPVPNCNESTSLSAIGFGNDTNFARNNHNNNYDCITSQICKSISADFSLRNLLDNNESSHSSRSSPSSVYSQCHCKSSNVSSNQKEENGKSRFDCKCNLKLSNQAAVLRRTIELEFALIPCKFTNITNRKELNQIESHKLDELVAANHILREPLPSNVIANPTELLDVIKMTDIAIRRLIAMSKKVTPFKNLCQEDQIALLKGGCTEMMVLRSVMSFNEEKETLQQPGDTNATLLKLEVLKQAKYNIYEAYKQFIKSFKEEWRRDENIFSILSAITLFTPERQHLIHTDLIKLEQQTYIYLLQRYLETKCPSLCEAKTEYLKLMERLEELHALNEDHVRIYLNVNPNDVGPLLIEIFDLKH